METSGVVVRAIFTVGRLVQGSERILFFHEAVFIGARLVAVSRLHRPSVKSSLEASLASLSSGGVTYSRTSTEIGREADCTASLGWPEVAVASLESATVASEASSSPVTC